MHCLEVIIYRNKQAAAQANSNGVLQHSWKVTHDGTGQITVTGNGHQVTINCSNPLLDQELAQFHRAFKNITPRWVRRQVEELASQYRRYIVVTGKWEECRREAERYRAESRQV